MGKQNNTITYIKVLKACFSSLAGYKISTDFLKPVRDFIKTGFELETKGTFLNYHNVAAEYNRLNAITGAK